MGGGVRLLAHRYLSIRRVLAQLPGIAYWAIQRQRPGSVRIIPANS